MSWHDLAAFICISSLAWLDPDLSGAAVELITDKNLLFARRIVTGRCAGELQFDEPADLPELAQAVKTRHDRAMLHVVGRRNLLPRRRV